MRLVWTSDIHLNHADFSAWDAWADSLIDAKADGMVITGDISEADDVVFQLQRITETVRTPIYFVLGNHDFYGASIAATRRRVAAVAREVPALCYLTDTSAVALQTGTVLIGEDGWGDGTAGDYDRSPVRLSDFVAIEEFWRVDPDQWQSLIREQGRQSAQRLIQKLDHLTPSTRRLIVATHVPPFREACWYEGQTTNDDWAPFFVCGQVGDVLMQFARRHPDIQTTVLCGHTHHAGTADLLPNLVVHTASADYGRPRIERVLQID